MKHFLSNVKLQQKRKKTFDRSWGLVFRNPEIWWSPGRACEGVWGVRRIRARVLGAREDLQVRAHPISISLVCMHTKPAGFPVEVFCSSHRPGARIA